ncbi:unnamed protein product [Effrenium voratum]|nr:unnamed protein product [Effrenium voratum]
MGQVCQRRAREAAQAPAPEVVLLPKKHDPKRYATDYSRFDNIEDSEEEKEDDKAEPQEPEPPEPEEPKTGTKNFSQEQRKELKEKFLKLSRNMNKEASRAPLPEEPAAPKARSLPKDHMKPVGTISPPELAKYSCSNDRMLLSCYGDIFDVSSRPDVYGWGPKSWQAGKDITWSVVLGQEKPDQCNRFYDMFKLDANHLSRYLTLVCNRLVALQEEFGKPVGRLDKFVHEESLPAAPHQEIEECKQQ